jgi:hypothetical protein
MNFELQFDPHRIPEFEARYSYEDDTAVLKAGRRIRAGAYTRQNLQVIYDWKTNGRGRSRLAKNDDAEIADALKLACLAATDRAALAVLTGLHGVDVPVASAVLWAVAPERFTAAFLSSVNRSSWYTWPTLARSEPTRTASAGRSVQEP